MTTLKSVLLLAFLSASLYSYSQKDNRDAVRISSGELLQQGDSLYDSTQYKRAIETFSQVDRSDTNYVRSLYGISLCYYAEELYEKSADYLYKALQLNTDFEKLQPDLLNQYANSLDAIGKKDEAIAIYDSALHRYPAYILFYLNKGNSLMSQKKYREAEKIMQQGLMVNPYSFSTYYRLGQTALYQGKLIPAMFCFVGSLLMSPDGKYHSRCIDMLSSISKNKDDVREYIDKRKEEDDQNYQLLEEIIQAKIALNTKYKLTIKLEDPICRQLQVLFEQLQYDPADNDFYMQFFAPFFKSVYADGQFENFINHIFSGVNIPAIQDYNKKNKKQIDAFIQQAADYFSTIRTSRELIYVKRNADSSAWFFENGGLDSHGKYIRSEKKTIGPWEFFYGPGNLKSKGLYDAEGKKDGPWTYYHANGKIRAKEFFKHGIREGEQIYHFSNGVMSSRSILKNDEEEGESTTYYFTGAVRIIGHYHAGKEEGKKIAFTYTGDTSYVENYAAGELQGESRTFSGGKLSTTSHYKDGKLDGPYKVWYRSGILKAEGGYKAGEQEGDWKYYHPNGRLKGIEHYVNQQLEGEYKEYDEDGVVINTGTLKAGKFDGEVNYFDHDGRQHSSFKYADGHIQEARFFDKKGQIIGTSRRNNGILDLVQYTPDGLKKDSGRYNQNGQITGRQVFYFGSGRIFETDDYVDGQEQGYSTAYYPNGTKKVETNYKDGKKNGYHCSYYQHGQKKEEGWYADDETAGSWVMFDELGHITDSISYLDGELDGFKPSYWPTGVKQDEVRFRSGWIQDWAQYDSTGKEISHTYFDNGSGLLKLVYPDGKPYMVVNYKQGSMDGAQRFYYPNGKPLYEASYIRGSYDGAVKGYTPTGIVTQEGQYDHGDRTGTWKYYTNTGILLHSVEYKLGKQEGKEIWYYENGRPETVTEYKDDERNGFYKSFSADGTLAYQLVYKEDHLISYTYLDKRDSLLPPIPLTGQSGKIKTFFPNGNVAAEMEYKDGVIDGPYKLYNTNGKIRVDKRRSYGVLEGPFTEYYSNGQVSVTGVYLHDQLQGVMKRFNDKGIPTDETNFYLDSPHGNTRIFDEKGKLKATWYYYYGKLLSIKNENAN